VREKQTETALDYFPSLVRSSVKVTSYFSSLVLVFVKGEANVLYTMAVFIVSEKQTRKRDNKQKLLPRKLSLPMLFSENISHQSRPSDAIHSPYRESAKSCE
jgi:hypothetical protein